MISVIIPTLNEETDLPGCLASVAWSDDVHVFDSFSSDRTVEVALALGAQVTQRRFDNYASHRNAALDLPCLRHDWVLFLDADERITPELAREMVRELRDVQEDVGAFRLRRRDIFMGKWLKHAQISPFYIRLLRRGQVRYEREVNEVARVRGEIRDLREPFDHFPFSKGLAHWVDKHNRYSSMEARCALSSRQGTVDYSPWRALFARDFNERRFHQKEWFYRLPARPLMKLLYMLFIRRGLLDGLAGIRYALLQTAYEYLIVLKTQELSMKTNPKGEAAGKPPVVARVTSALGAHE